MIIPAQRPAIEAILHMLWPFRLCPGAKYSLLGKELFLLGISDIRAVGARHAKEVAVLGYDASSSMTPTLQNDHVVNGLVLLRRCYDDEFRSAAPHPEARILVVEALGVLGSSGDCVNLRTVGAKQSYVVAP